MTPNTDYGVPVYMGGKKLAAKWIVTQLPDAPVYIEPFCGMAAVLLARPKAKVELINDRDDHIHAFWIGVRDHPDELAAYLTDTPWSRTERAAARARLANPADLTPVEWAAAVAIVLNQSLLGTLNDDLWLSTSYQPNYVHPDRTPLDPTTKWRRLTAGLPALTERLRHVQLDNRDAIDIIERHTVSPHAVVYIDPPYDERRGYRHTANLDDLADILRDARAQIAISGYPTCGWNERLPNYRRIDYQRRGSPAAKGNATRINECLWTNYDHPNRLL